MSGNNKIFHAASKATSKYSLPKYKNGGNPCSTALLLTSCGFLSIGTRIRLPSTTPHGSPLTSIKIFLTAEFHGILWVILDLKLLLLFLHLGEKEYEEKTPSYKSARSQPPLRKSVLYTSANCL